MRRQLDLGQADLAKVCGVQQATVSKWESGAKPLAREAATELHKVLELAPVLDPAMPEPIGTDEECERRYQEHTNHLIIQSGPDADWRASQLCSAMSPLANSSAGAAQILASLHANRSLWHLVHWNPRAVTRHASAAIRLGARHGFTLESGYAFWSLARTRFTSGFGTAEDVDFLDRELRVAEAKSGVLSGPYNSLLKGARAMAVGDYRTCETEMDRARDHAPDESSSGIVGRWGGDYWRRDVANYHAMLALSAGQFAECCRIVEPFAEEPFAGTLSRQYGQSLARHYHQVALVRLGCRERVATHGPLVAGSLLNLVKCHTTRLSGCRFSSAT